MADITPHQLVQPINGGARMRIARPWLSQVCCPLPPELEPQAPARAMYRQPNAARTISYRSGLSTVMGRSLVT